MNSNKEEIGKEIQLELPDYSQMYLEWKKRQEEIEKESKKEENIIIIDIY